jgi:hypothetical protein
MVLLMVLMAVMAIFVAPVAYAQEQPNTTSVVGYYVFQEGNDLLKIALMADGTAYLSDGSLLAGEYKIYDDNKTVMVNIDAGMARLLLVFKVEEGNLVLRLADDKRNLKKMVFVKQTNVTNLGDFLN